MESITVWQDAAKRGDNINHQVDANQIIETEHTCLGNPHGAAHQRVSLLNCEVATHGLINPDLKRKDANAVAEETRGVCASHNTLAKDTVIEICKPINDVVACFVTADQFQQPHIANRVEVMGNGKPLAEAVRHVFDQQADWDGRGVGAHNTVGTDSLVKATIQGFLDIQTFNNSFNDPVCICQLVKVIINGAGVDTGSVSLMHQLWRV